MLACQKRPIPMKELDSLVEKVERQAFQSGVDEILSTEIGKIVMDELRKLDEVAYVRFASVYRQFTDVNSFMEELHSLSQSRTEQ